MCLASHAQIIPESKGLFRCRKVKLVSMFLQAWGHEQKILVLVPGCEVLRTQNVYTGKNLDIPCQASGTWFNAPENYSAWIM